MTEIIDEEIERLLWEWMGDWIWDLDFKRRNEVLLFAKQCWLAGMKHQYAFDVKAECRNIEREIAVQRLRQEVLPL